MRFSTRAIARAGIIAAMYTVLTLVALPLAFGPIQVRAAEALTLLPLFYPEAIPALFIGCILANIMSSYGVFDVVFGSLATLLAAFCTYYVGKLFRFGKPLPLDLSDENAEYQRKQKRRGNLKKALTFFLAGLAPVLLNAVTVPLIIYFTSVKEGYWINFATILATQSIWVYGLGIPFCVAIQHLKRKSRFLN